MEKLNKSFSTVSKTLANNIISHSSEKLLSFTNKIKENLKTLFLNPVEQEEIVTLV